MNLRSRALPGKSLRALILGAAAVLAPAAGALGAEASEPAGPTAGESAPAVMEAIPDPNPADAAPSDSQSSPRLIPIPFFYYSPETRFAGGAAAIYLFGPRAGRNEEDPRSSIFGVGIHTQNRQSLLSAGTELYGEGGAVEIQAGVSYQKFPTSFYGMGNDTRVGADEEYTPEEFTATLQGIRDVGAGFRLGGRVDADHLRLARTEADGRLAAGGIPGINGGWTRTAAALARFDTRDRRTGPSRGVFLQAEVGGAGRVLGSDYAFRSYLVDARGYVPAFASQVIAVRGVTRLSGGTVPFHRMPVLGGAGLLRGYYEGRFRDRQLAAFQVEDRIPVAGRFGAALFAGAGQVAGTVSRFRTDRFHLSWGWGARVVLSREDSLVLRLDQGYGEDQSGFYLSIGEAY